MGRQIRGSKEITTNKWDSLSMKERGNILRIGVKNGIFNLNKIKNIYNKYDDGGYKETLGGSHGEVPFTSDYSKIPERKSKEITIDNLHELVYSNPRLYKEYMSRLPEKDKARVIENAARSRVDYEGLNQAMLASATGGLPGLAGYVGTELVNEAVRNTTDKDSWGQYIYRGNNETLRALAEMTNPGALLGAFGAANSITSRPKINSIEVPSMTRQGTDIIMEIKPRVLNNIDEAALAKLNPSTSSKHLSNLKQSLYRMPLDKSGKIDLDKGNALIRAINYTDNPTIDLAKRYITEGTPENIERVTPMIKTRLPYKKSGKYMESERTLPWLKEYLDIDLRNPEEGRTIKSYEHLNEITQKAYDDSYKMLQYIGKGDEVYLPKRSINDILQEATIRKLQDIDPTIKISDKAQQALNSNTGVTNIRTKEGRESVRNFINLEKELTLLKYKNLREAKRDYQAIDRLVESVYKRKMSKIGESLKEYPAIRKVVEESPLYYDDAIEAVKRAKATTNDIKDIERQVITDLLLQKHRFVRGVNLEFNNPELVRRALSTIPDNIYGGRSDLPASALDKHLDALYTSNSYGTALSYSRESAPGTSRIGIIGKSLEDLDLSGDISTWWSKNDLPEPYLDNSPTKNKVYNIIARSVLPSERASRKVNYSISDEYPESRQLLRRSLNRWLSRSSKSSRSNILKEKALLYEAASGDFDTPFSHFLFIGEPKSELPGYRLLEILTPEEVKKKYIKQGDIVTRAHEGTYSKGLSKGRKYGGHIKR